MDSDARRRYNRCDLMHLYPKEKNADCQEFTINNATRNSNGKKPFYSPYWSPDKLDEMIKCDQVILGNIRINPKRFVDSYVRHPLGDTDVFISGLANRNRALPDDVVAVEILPKRHWRVFDNVAVDIGEVVENKAIKYITLEEVIFILPNRLEELLGAEFVKGLLADLDTNTDPLASLPSQPVGGNEPANDLQSTLLPWWTVFQRTGRVVHCQQKLHPRVSIGYLQLQHTNRRTSTGTDELASDTPNASRSQKWSHAILVPVDSRLPRIMLPRDRCPADFQQNPESCKNVRYVVEIVQWSEHSIFPLGRLIRQFSSDANCLIETETDRILIKAGFVNGLEAINDFPDDVQFSVEKSIAGYTDPMKLVKEYRLRRDFRSHCVLSIDPSTARDLDDALHVRPLTDEEKKELASKGLDNAAYEVGVHIADVTYFVRADSPVDCEASRRATTIYLTQLCVPMLPRSLCEQVCSLNPCEDKLTFSVVFTVSHEAKVLQTWFGRTVVRSCAKLSYEEAQYLIDCDSSADLDTSSLPSVEAPHTIETVYDRIQTLHKLATMMRKSRFLGGSLRLNQVRPSFALDDSKRLPIGLSSYISKPSNWLVEEWMLAANQAVACRIAAGLPKTALLRRHPAPSLKQCVDVANQLSSLGFVVETQSAHSIQVSLCREAGCSLDTDYQYSADLTSLCADMVGDASTVQHDLLDKLSAVALTDPPTVLETSTVSGDTFGADKSQLLEKEARLLVAVAMLTKVMNLAKYFCLGRLYPGESARHYALNMAFYTHFTSPIRRFADVIVHRQLAAVLANEAESTNNEELAQWYGETAFSNSITPSELNNQAEICNSKKLSAHQAGLDSAELFFVLFVKETGPLVEAAVVLSVMNRSFDVLLLANGMTHRVRINSLDLRSTDYVAVSEAAGGKRTGAVLCLLWNYPPSSGDATGLKVVDQGPAEKPPCTCFYSEVRSLDILRCRVAIEATSSSSSSREETPVKESQQYYRGGDDLPKLLVTILRPTCEKCIHLGCH